MRSKTAAIGTHKPQNISNRATGLNSRTVDFVAVVDQAIALLRQRAA